MKKEIKNLIIDWNSNTSKLSNGSIFKTNNTPNQLIEYCLKIHTEVDVKNLLISLNNQKEKFDEILKIDSFIKALEHTYHSKLLDKSKNVNKVFKYEGERRGTLDLVIARNLEYSDNEIVIKNITQEVINQEIVKQYKNKQYYSNECFNFIFYQCELNNYKLDIIKNWVTLYNTKDESDIKFSLLSKLPSFFKSLFRLNNNLEKLNLWINEYFKNNGFVEFKKYFEFNLKDNSDEIIEILKKLHFEKLLGSYKEKLKNSIDTNSFIENEIKRFKKLIKTKPSFDPSYYRNEKPSYYRSYNALVNGNREFFDDFIKKDRAGEVEAIFSYIEYLENQNLKRKKQKVVKEFINSDSKDLLPIEIFDGTKGYLKKNAIQVNICYKHKAYDGCSILLRKITEVLIIELYEKFELEGKIQDEDGNYFMLKKLIKCFQNEVKFKNILTRNVNEALPKIKRNGDLSAHNRKYNSRKLDIDKLSDDFRLLFEELVNTIYH